MKLELCEKCLEENKELAGKQVYIPKKQYLDESKVLDLMRGGKTIRQIADGHGMSTRQVYDLFRNGQN